MKKSLTCLLFLLVSFLIPLISASKVHAIEPDEAYFYESLFPLFAFIPPPKFQVFENLERIRRYEDLEVCGMNWDDLNYSIWAWGHGAKKDNKCMADVDCDKRQVQLCHKGTDNVARTENANGSCQLPPIDPLNPEKERVGKCSFRGIPRTMGNLTSTDFSSKNTSSTSVFSPIPTSPSSSPADNSSSTPQANVLVYPKYQNESMAYDYSGSDNAITWGSHNLALGYCDQAVRKMIVLAKARQTKQTIHKTGTFPLGWVDYEFVTNNGKTLDQIFNEVVNNDPSGSLLVGPTLGMIQSIDNFYISVGQKSEDTSGAYTRICDTVTKYKDEDWVADIMQSPMYPPSKRRGYARGSVCVWNLCFPNPEIEIKLPNRGTSEALYVDSSIHPTFAAAIDSLFINYPLSQALAVYKTLAFSNPAIRWALVADEHAIPDKVYETLISEGAKTYGPGTFSLPHLGHIYDYQQLMDGWGYEIQPILTKETAGAIDLSPVSIINILYYKIIDSADDIHRHLITIPDLMGQSINLLKEAVYDTRDSATVLDDPYRNTISNIVDNTQADHFYAGKYMGVYDSKRNLASYPCSNPLYSSPNQTSIEAYALGNTFDCYGNSNGPSTISSSAGSTTGICSVAAKYNVPCCMLAGIWSVETDKSANIPNQSKGGYKCCNSVGACGATQIMQGLVPPLSNGEKLNPCKENDSFALTARMLNVKKCQLAGGCQDNKWTPEVSRKYPIKDTDLAIAGMYYGTNNCAPDQFTQERWGSGKSYCDAVKDYMNNKCVEKKSAQSTTSSTTPAASTAPSARTPAVTRTADLPQTCGQGIQTALGCLPFTRDALISTLLTFVVGIAGSIALITMLIATFQIMTAGDNAEQLKKGKELFASAVLGLLFLIFSVSLLRIVAGNILRLPGF